MFTDGYPEPLRILTTVIQCLLSRNEDTLALETMRIMTLPNSTIASFFNMPHRLTRSSAMLRSQFALPHFWADSTATQ